MIYGEARPSLFLPHQQRISRGFKRQQEKNYMEKASKIFGSGYCSGIRMHFFGTIILALPVCARVFLYLLTCVAIVFIQLRT